MPETQMITASMDEPLRAQADLAATEVRYRRVFENSPIGKSITEINGTMRVNDAFCAMLGYTEQELGAKRWQEITHPDDIAASQAAVDRLLAGLDSSFHLEKRYLRKNGTVIWTDVRTWLYRDDDNTPSFFVSSVVDITERHLAEAEIRRLNAELEQRVAERTAQLQAANRELEAFAYSVSHDLRAPLRAMSGFSSTLLANYGPQLDAQGQHYLERIEHAAQRMGQLINDLLSLSRINRAELKLLPVDLSAMAGEISAELQARDPARSAEITIAPKLHVNGDAHLLRIALQNLLENAWKFTSTRATTMIEVGKLPPATAGWHAAIAGLPPGASLPPGTRIYFVRDNGVGFDMAFSDKLFGPFQRLHAMNEFPGSGIGLAIVQRIITRHDGRIWPAAAVEQGATFYFTLGATA